MIFEANKVWVEDNMYIVFVYDTDDFITHLHHEINSLVDNVELIFFKCIFTIQSIKNHVILGPFHVI